MGNQLTGLLIRLLLILLWIMQAPYFDMYASKNEKDLKNVITLIMLAIFTIDAILLF